MHMMRFHWLTCEMKFAREQLNPFAGGNQLTPTTRWKNPRLGAHANHSN
jgi:hypothetical protein